MYYLNTYASTECLKQTSTLQTFAFIMNWMKYHFFFFFDVWELFCVSSRHQKYNSPKLFFCCSITAYNTTHTIEKPIAALSVSSDKLSVGFTWKSTIDCVLLRLYPLLPKTALPSAQSSFTKSNDCTVTAHHVPFAREKSLISLTSVQTMYINISSQYDIVSMAKRFHIGFYSKCKKKWNVYALHM